MREREKRRREKRGTIGKGGSRTKGEAVGRIPDSYAYEIGSRALEAVE